MSSPVNDEITRIKYTPWERTQGTTTGYLRLLRNRGSGEISLTTKPDEKMLLPVLQSPGIH